VMKRNFFDKSVQKLRQFRAIHAETERPIRLQIWLIWPEISRFSN